MADEFDAIEPAPVELTVGGKAFALRPVTMDRLPAFARALRPIMPTIAELMALDEKADPQYAADTLLELVDKDGEQMVEALAVAIAKDKADIAAQRLVVGGLNSADFLALALPAIKVNADFFARRLLPMLLAMWQEAKAATTTATPGAGPTPSSS